MRYAFRFALQANRSVRRWHVGNPVRTCFRPRDELIRQREVIELLELAHKIAKYGLIDSTLRETDIFHKALAIKSYSAVRINRHGVNRTGPKASSSRQSDLIIVASRLIVTVRLVILPSEDCFRNQRMHAFVPVDKLRDIEIRRHTRQLVGIVARQM